MSLNDTASFLFYSVVCWGSNTSKEDTSRTEKLIKWAGSVVGMKLDSLVTVAEKRTLDKLLDRAGLYGKKFISIYFFSYQSISIYIMI